jgi:hypothetical protein
MNNCLFKVKVKGYTAKVKVFGVDYDKEKDKTYFLLWNKVEKIFEWNDTKDFEPVPEVEEDKNC